MSDNIGPIRYESTAKSVICASCRNGLLLNGLVAPDLSGDYNPGMSDWMREVGLLVRRQRKVLGISTQSALAKIAKVGVESISRIERGQNTTTDTLEAVARALKVDVRLLTLGYRGTFPNAQPGASVLSEPDERLWMMADEAHRRLARAALRASQPGEGLPEMVHERHASFNALPQTYEPEETRRRRPKKR